MADVSLLLIAKEKENLKAVVRLSPLWMSFESAELETDMIPDSDFPFPRPILA